MDDNKYLLTLTSTLSAARSGWYLIFKYYYRHIRNRPNVGSDHDTFKKEQSFFFVISLDVLPAAEVPEGVRMRLRGGEGT